MDNLEQIFKKIIAENTSAENINRAKSKKAYEVFGGQRVIISLEEDGLHIDGASDNRVNQFLLGYFMEYVLHHVNLEQHEIYDLLETSTKYTEAIADSMREYNLEDQN